MAARRHDRHQSAITLPDGSVVKPTYCANAETCEGVPLHLYDTVFVDVPYSDVDAAKYGVPMLKRVEVLKALTFGLKPGALIVWLDEVTPTKRNAWPLKWEAGAGPSTSGGHRTGTGSCLSAARGQRRERCFTQPNRKGRSMTLLMPAVPSVVLVHPALPQLDSRTEAAWLGDLLNQSSRRLSTSTSRRRWRRPWWSAPHSTGR